MAMAEDAGMFMVHKTIGKVLCCKCGILMPPNATNMCVKCLRSEVDITQGLLKHLDLMHCPKCDSYLQPPRKWVKLQLESKEFLTFCLKKLQKNMNANKVRNVRAEFIPTEIHSKRVKIKVWVQKEVLKGAILEQSYPVLYFQKERMCESCSKVQANPVQNWIAVVQLRQHVSHRRTFFYLEHLILKHNAAGSAVRIKQMDQGIDFFFSNKSHAVNFVDFIGKVAPVRSRNRHHDNKKLVSHDSKSNKYNYKYTFSVEISPICREDLIYLPPEGTTESLGKNLGPIVICTKVTNNIVLLNPFTLRHCFLNADQYWRASFKSLRTSRQLVVYKVLRVDVGDVPSAVTVDGTKYVLADAEVARVKDHGKNDTKIFIKTHLGHLLKPGYHAVGYDLYGANINDCDVDLPAAILIKKCYEAKRQKKRREKPRSWKLKSLHMEVDDKGRLEQDKIDSEYELFLKDLEENPDLRFNISLYGNKDNQPSETDGEELPSVPLEELLADLDLSEERRRRKMRKIT